MAFCNCFGEKSVVLEDKNKENNDPPGLALNGDSPYYQVVPPDSQKITEPSKSPFTEASQPSEEALQCTPLELTVEELKSATAGFEQESYLGEGARGRFFKGTLFTGAQIAIKVLKSVELSESEFLSMVHVIGALSHGNLVPLMGYCLDGDTRMLVYEYAPYGSLHDFLHGWKEGRPGSSKPLPALHWAQRIKIAMGAAQGLHFLHERSHVRGLKLAHRGVKSSNVLLYEDYVAKLGDFNFTKELVDPAAPFDPEHDFSRQLIPEKQQEEKADVYGLGVLLLELLTGRKPVDPTAPHNQQSLVDWAMPRLNADKVKSIVDPRLKGRFPDEGPLRLGMVAALCMDDIDFRPSMPIVIEAIQALIALSH